MSFHVISCHFMSFRVISCHFMLFTLTYLFCSLQHFESWCYNQHDWGNDYFSHFVSFHVIVSLFVIICHCLILCRSCPYFCLIPRHDDSQQDHFKCFVFFFHFSFVLFIVSNIPRHDVTINMIEEMTATVVQLQEENRYFYTNFL